MSEETKNMDGVNPNPETETPVTNPEDLAGGETDSQAIDYKEKFSQSSKEALRLREESKAKDAEIERLRKLTEGGASYGNESDSLYPGFEDLDEAQQKSLLEYTNSITNKVKQDIYSDPAIAFAKESHNETVWNQAFESVLNKYPELGEQKLDFKSRYYNKNNVPSNIGSILEDLAKVYLFDKSREIGAREALEQIERIDTERANGGNKEPIASRTLEDWQKLAASNPAEFARRSKEYNNDLESGKLK